MKTFPQGTCPNAGGGGAKPSQKFGPPPTPLLVFFNTYTACRYPDNPRGRLLPVRGRVHVVYPQNPPNRVVGNGWSPGGVGSNIGSLTFSFSLNCQLNQLVSPLHILFFNSSRAFLGENLSI